MALVVAHVSDTHVSRFGEHVTSLRGRKLHGRAVKPQAWDVVERVEGWTIERREAELRLVDEAGKVHDRRKVEPGDVLEARKELGVIVQERMRTEYRRLAKRLPTRDELEALLAEDPHNTNLLFCRAARTLLEEEPDWIVLTGDVTDDSVGYELVESAFASYIERGRLLAVPGNHDIYSSPLWVVPGHARKKISDKREAWARFARVLGLPGDGTPWIRELGEGAWMSGLDSCIPARTPLSASGAIDEDALGSLEKQLDQVPKDACRMAMLHHHVVNPPIRAVGGAPWQLGMRLRNAKQVYEFFRRLGFSCVLNGHRHVGYRFHPSHAPLFVSAPSATLGCRSGAAPRPFYWRLELQGGEVSSVRERLL